MAKQDKLQREAEKAYSFNEETNEAFIDLDKIDPSVDFVQFPDGSTLERVKEDAPLTPETMPSGMVGSVVDSARAAASDAANKA